MEDYILSKCNSVVTYYKEEFQQTKIFEKVVYRLYNFNIKDLLEFRVYTSFHKFSTFY